MKITGNDLPTGDVLWWTGAGGSRHLAEAVDVGEGGEAILAAEEAARRVNASYVVEAHPGSEGPMPDHIKDRVRAAGPPVRPPLGNNPAVAEVESGR